MATPWPRRPRLVAGNWKMFKTPAEGSALAREFVALRAADPAGSSCQVALCPPFPALAPVAEALRGSGVCNRRRFVRGHRREAHLLRTAQAGSAPHLSFDLPPFRRTQG